MAKVQARRFLVYTVDEERRMRVSPPLLGAHAHGLARRLRRQRPRWFVTVIDPLRVGGDVDREAWRRWCAHVFQRAPRRLRRMSCRELALLAGGHLILLRTSEQEAARLREAAARLLAAIRVWRAVRPDAGERDMRALLNEARSRGSARRYGRA